MRATRLRSLNDSSFNSVGNFASPRLLHSEPMICGVRSGELKAIPMDPLAIVDAIGDSGKKKRRPGDKKKRPGGVLGVEPFDPADHVEKEVGDALSMWLVIAGGGLVALLMRYVLMPGMSGPKDVLWFLPLALVVVIAPLHKVVIPEPWKSRYTFGNWFRASMLYVFTWLAFSFLLVNPPIGDVGAPDVSGSYTVIIIDGEDILIDSGNLTSSKGAFTLDRNNSTGEAYMVFAINDNTDPGLANLSMTLLSSEFGASPVEVVSAKVSTLGCDAVWDGLRSSQQNSIVKHEFDSCVSIGLGEISAGEYVVTVELTEQGDPWDNSRTLTYSLTVIS